LDESWGVVGLIRTGGTGCFQILEPVGGRFQIPIYFSNVEIVREHHQISVGYKK
jgi:hypothetical protein